VIHCRAEIDYRIRVRSEFAAMAGLVTAIRRGAPRLIETDMGYNVIEGAPASLLNAFICIFDIDASSGHENEGDTGVAGARDISPVRIETFIRIDPETLARHAFIEVPNEILRNIAGEDLILASIRSRLARWWPEVVGSSLGNPAIPTPVVPRRSRPPRCDR
jgi:hypothetical protein